MGNSWREWGKSIGQNALFTVLWALIPGGLVTYLAHVGSVWTIPALKGLGAAVMAVGIIFGTKAMSRLPPRRLMPSTENIESCVRTWLDNYRVAVKNNPKPEAFFYFFITLDSGDQLIVSRIKNDYPEYVHIVAHLAATEDERKIIDQFSEYEKNQLLLNMKLELARAKVGYGGLVDPSASFHLFRRVPIHHNLTEYTFMAMIAEVEAAVHLISIVFQRAQYEAKSKPLKDEPPPLQLKS